MSSRRGREIDWHEWRAEQRDAYMELFGMGEAEATIEAERAERRARTRSLWAQAQLAAWRVAMEGCDAAWMKLVQEHPDDEEVEPPPEQDVLDRIYREMRDVADHDRWPRHLHWGGL